MHVYMSPRVGWRAGHKTCEVNNYCLMYSEEKIFSKILEAECASHSL
jgi:hypothetical protein